MAYLGVYKAFSPIHTNCHICGIIWWLSCKNLCVTAGIAGVILCKFITKWYRTGKRAKEKQTSRLPYANLLCFAFELRLGSLGYWSVRAKWPPPPAILPRHEWSPYVAGLMSETEKMPSLAMHNPCIPTQLARAVRQIKHRHAGSTGVWISPQAFLAQRAARNRQARGNLLGFDPIKLESGGECQDD